MTLYFILNCQKTFFVMFLRVRVHVNAGVKALFGGERLSARQQTAG